MSDDANERPDSIFHPWSAGTVLGTDQDPDAGLVLLRIGRDRFALPTSQALMLAREMIRRAVRVETAGRAEDVDASPGVRFRGDPTGPFPPLAPPLEKFLTELHPVVKATIAAVHAERDAGMLGDGARGEDRHDALLAAALSWHMIELFGIAVQRIDQMLRNEGN